MTMTKNFSGSMPVMANGIILDKQLVTRAGNTKKESRKKSIQRIVTGKPEGALTRLSKVLDRMFKLKVKNKE